MPHRLLSLWTLLLAVLGLAIVAAFILMGRDLQQATRTGPRWRRRLLAAALVLLAEMGLPMAGSLAGQEPTAATQPANIQETEQWKWISFTWAEAEKILAEDPSSPPFDQRHKRILLADLDQAANNIADLQKSGMLSEAEAKLLAANLGLLRKAVYRRPAIDDDWVCYQMMSPRAQSKERLQARLPLLKDLAASGRLDPAVVEMLLKIVEEDLRTLQDENSFKEVPDTPQDIRQLRDQAAKYVKTIRANMTVSTSQPATAPARQPSEAK